MAKRCDDGCALQKLVGNYFSNSLLPIYLRNLSETFKIYIIYKTT